MQPPVDLARMAKISAGAKIFSKMTDLEKTTLDLHAPLDELFIHLADNPPAKTKTTKSKKTGEEDEYNSFTYFYEYKLKARLKFHLSDTKL